MPRKSWPKLDLTGTTCIWGKSESGKTYLAQKMIDQAKPKQVVIISPQSLEGTDAPGVKAALEAGAPRIICNTNFPEQMRGAIFYALNHSTEGSPVGQRPAAVHAELRSQAKATFWMCLTDHRDISTAKESLGPRAEDLKGFKQGQFIKWPE